MFLFKRNKFNFRTFQFSPRSLVGTLIIARTTVVVYISFEFFTAGDHLSEENVDLPRVAFIEILITC